MLMSMKDRLKAGFARVTEIEDNRNERLKNRALADADENILKVEAKLALTVASLDPEYEDEANAIVQRLHLNDHYLSITNFCREYGFGRAAVQVRIDIGALQVYHSKRNQQLIRVDEGLAAMASPFSGQRPVTDAQRPHHNGPTH